jgi:flagellar L-ring protein precursor FlgH
MSARIRQAGLATAAVLLSLLSACTTLTPMLNQATGPQPRPAAMDEPPPVARNVPHKGQAGGVFMREASWSLISDSPAFRAGDVVTVVLDETTQASKKADSSFGKQSSVGVQPSILAGKTLKTDITLGAQRDFAGTSSSTQQNTLQGAITVIVQEVLPNGLLRIAGEKTLFLNQGEEFVRLSGYLRAADIDADNRISSQRVANARIAYSGQGAGADSNNAGWLTRFFNSPWMPF